MSRKLIDSLKRYWALNNETIPEENYVIFDPLNPWKKKTLNNYTVRPLQELIFENGNLVYKEPEFKDIVENAKCELNTLWDEVKRLKNPHKYSFNHNILCLLNKLSKNARKP